MAPFLSKMAKQTTTNDESTDSGAQNSATAVPVTLEPAPRQASDNASLILQTGSVGSHADLRASPKPPSKIKSFLLATFGCFFADGASIYGGDNADPSRPVSGIIPAGGQARAAANGSGHGGNYITPYTSIREPSNNNNSTSGESAIGLAVGSQDQATTVRRPAILGGGPPGGSSRNAMYIPEAPPSRSYRRGIPGELLELHSDARGKVASGDAANKCKWFVCPSASSHSPSSSFFLPLPLSVSSSVTVYFALYVSLALMA